MPEPLWLRSAATAAALTGLTPDAAAAGFCAADGLRLRGALSALVAGHDRRAASRAIATERMRVVHARPVTPRDDSAGVRVLAAVFAAMPREDRARVARSFDADSLRRARAHTHSGIQVRGRDVMTAVRSLSRALGRTPRLEDLAALVDAATRDDAKGSDAVHTALRALRVHGVDPSALFEPFAEDVASQ